MNTKKTIKSHLPHDRLSDKIWTNDKMLPKFREALLKIAGEFIDYLGIPIDVVDITMTGSYANYNYTVFSDIDLHIIVDMESLSNDTDLVEEFFNAKRSFWNDRHDITLKGIEVELYPQDADEEHNSTGVYSIYDDMWVVKPKKFKDKIDVERIEKDANKIIKEIEAAIKSSIKRMDEKPISRILKKLKKMRSSGLERSGELSHENITYKVTRAQGFLQKLFDTKYEIQDKNLSTIK